MANTEDVLTTIKAGIAGVPFVGGPIATLIGDYIQEETEKSIEISLRHLKRTIARVSSRIDAEKVDRAEFSELFKSCYLVIVRAHRREKLEAAVHIIVNTLLRPGDPDKVTFDDLDFFVRALDRLSYGALRALAVLDSRSRSDGWMTLKSILAEFSESPEQLPEAFLSEVHALGFAEQHRPAVAGPDGSRFSYRLTAIGKRFVASVLSWHATDD